jgi:Zn-dependent protease with chaperone function
MIAPDFLRFTQVSAARVLNTIVEGLVLALLSWLLLRLMAGRRAVLRFAVWFSTLLSVVTMPLLVKASSASAWHLAGLELSGSWAPELFVGWALIATLLLLRLGSSLAHVRHLRRQSSPLSRPDLLGVLEQNSFGRNVQLLVSEGVRVPTALGFFRPAVVIPAWALNDLSPDELKVVLLHELAHLRRWDDWTNLAQKFLKALFFFHPAVWWIDSRLSLEREMACDDLVLAQTSNARSYAASLISVAEKALARKARLERTLLLAQNALGRMRQTSLRIAEILNPMRGNNPQWKSAVPIGAALMLLGFLGTSYMPQVIAFRSPGQPDLRARSQAPRLSMPPVPLPAVRVSMNPSEPATKPLVIAVHLAMPPATRPRVKLAKAGSQSAAEVMLVSMRLDDSGATVWTVSVWRVPTGRRAARQLEEAFVMNSI